MSEQDLSNFAAFDLDDLLAEIGTQNKSTKEVTAYLDRSFIVNMINQYHEQSKINKPDFNIDNQINYTEYNFTGADFTGIKRKDFELFNFQDCDITEVHLDRTGIEFFHEYIVEGRVIYQGINLQNAYLGPLLTKRIELGIECFMYLNLSNMNLTGSNFSYANIDGLILDNTNIAGCNFIGAKNLNLRQFIFTMGFETAIFSNDKKIDKAMKDKIKFYSENPDSVDTYSTSYQKFVSKVTAYLANVTNILDD